MSFALDYRKKLQEQDRREKAFRKANEGFVTLPQEADVDTRGNGRRVLMALIIAGSFLAILNSAGLVNYAYGLADSRLGRTLVVASEQWHQMMERGRATQVVDHIRGSVAMMRETSWQDLKMVFLSPQPEMSPERPQVIPAKAPQPAAEPEEPENAKPAPIVPAPAAPVMRAAIDAVSEARN